ncbi:hypothetical protein L195_g062405, partial [Trifolium pratense]
MGRVVYGVVLVVVVMIISPCLVNGRNNFHEKTRDGNGVNSTHEVSRGDQSFVKDFHGSKTDYSSEEVLGEKKLGGNNGGKGVGAGGG